MVKLVREESESSPLRTFLADADILSSELALTEIPRAIRCTVLHEPKLPLGLLIERAGELLDAIALRPLDSALLAAAGTLVEPALRALDAIHVASAVDLRPVDAFLTYDERQAAAAPLAGLRTVALGV